MISYFIWEIPARGLSANWYATYFSRLTKLPVLFTALGTPRAMNPALSNQFYALAKTWDTTYDGPDPGRSSLFQIDCPVESTPRPNFSLEYLTNPTDFKCTGYQYCPCFVETSERSKCWYNLPVRVEICVVDLRTKRHQCDDAGTMTCDAPALIEGCTSRPGSIGCKCPCQSVVGLNNVRCVQGRCIVTSGESFSRRRIAIDRVHHGWHYCRHRQDAGAAHVATGDDTCHRRTEHGRGALSVVDDGDDVAQR